MRACCAAVLLVLLGCGEPTPPNLVLVIGDDQHWSDFGFMGSPRAQTPQLDRLAAEGTVFRTGYTAASVCRPSLLALLTGLEPDRYAEHVRRLEQRAGRRLSAGEVIRQVETLPRRLRERGYVSFQAGKHFEGSAVDAGFDAGMIRSPGDDDEILARKTLEPVFRFLEQHREEPFFLWFAPKLPHVPHDPPQRFLDLYRDRELPPRTLRYYANVTRLDAAVGALLERLDALGLGDRTLVAFLSDNGWVPGAEPGPYLWSLGGPKGKSSLYDAGLRTPIVVRGPGVQAGAVRDELVSAFDLFPTFLDYAGAGPVKGRPGRSLRPLLEGRAGAAREALVVSMQRIRADTADGRVLGKGPLVPGGVSVRTRRWHLLDYWQREPELYDVVADPEETRNLAAERPDVVARLRRHVRDERSPSR
jgi:uncharacterized sulfatase